MNHIIDSSAWLAFFADLPVARRYADIIEQQTTGLIVPAITIYEVFKKILLERDETTALCIIAHLRLGKVIDLDTDIALLAAKLSKEHKLAMADSIILATARRHQATIWTLDSDFRNIPGVRYFSKNV